MTDEQVFDWHGPLVVSDEAREALEELARLEHLVVCVVGEARGFWGLLNAFLRNSL
jgi:hypothetical protein